MKDGATLPLLLKELRLPTMSKLWSKFSQEAVDKGWSPAQYLTLLCDHELAARETRRLATRLRESGLLRGKSLENFDFKEVPDLNKLQVMGLAKGEVWIPECMNVLIFGPSGTGKSHLASGIGQELISNGYRVFFTRTTEFLQKLQAAKRDLSLPSMLAKLDKYDCLMLDDFGYVKKNVSETDVLFDVICERYERRSLLITCNQPFSEWDQIFEDKRTAIAAVDRLVHHAVFLEMNVGSYRKKIAEERRRK